MDKIRAKELDIIKKVVKIAFFPLLILLFSGHFAQFKGFLFGIIISLLAFHHIFVTGIRAFSGPEDKVRGRIVKFYTIRYVIYAAAIYSAFKAEDMDLAATVIGLLMIKIVLVGDALFGAIKRYLTNRVENYSLLRELPEHKEEENN